jgi:hypothetical protein
MEQSPMERKPKRLPDVRLRKVFDRLLLLRVHVTMETNEVGALIWSLCNGQSTLDSIIQRVVTEFDVDQATSQNDVLEFIRSLEESQMIEWA